MWVTRVKDVVEVFLIKNHKKVRGGFHTRRAKRGKAESTRDEKKG